MCLLIVKPEGKELDRDDMNDAFDYNDDGAGFAAKKNGTIYMRKGYFKFSDFWAAFEPFADCEAIVHFRQVSSGLVNVDNCHPFRLVDGSWLAHNGHMSTFHRMNSKKSDTATFVEEVINPLLLLRPNALDDNAILSVIEKMVDWNRFAIIRPNRPTIILNEELGEDEGDIWYSNLYHRRIFARGGNYTYGMFDYDDDTVVTSKAVTVVDASSSVIHSTRAIPQLPAKKKEQLCDFCAGEVEYHVCESCFGEGHFWVNAASER